MKIARARLGPLVLVIAVVLAMVGSTSSHATSPQGVKPPKRPAIAVSVDEPRPGQVFRVTSRIGPRMKRPVKLQRYADGRWATVRRSTTDRRGRAAFSWQTSEPTERVRIVAPRVRRDGAKVAARTSRSTTITTRTVPVVPPTTPTTPTPTATPTPTTPVPSQTASFTATRDAEDRVDVVLSTTPSAPGRVMTLQAMAPGGTWRDVASRQLGSGTRTEHSDLVPVSDVRGHRLRVRLGAFQGLSELDTDVLAPPEVVVEVGFSGRRHEMVATTTGQVDEVRFFVDGVMVEQDTAAPWTYQATLAPGRHDVMARAVGPLESRLGPALEVPALSTSVESDSGMADGFRLETVQSGLDLPTSAEAAGSTLVFVTEKSGLVKAVAPDGQGGWELPRTVLDLRDLVFDEADAGLTGLSVDPDFAQNGYVYLAYVLDEGTGDLAWKSQQVVRYTWDGTVLQPGSRHVVLGAVTGTACHDPENIRTPGCMPLFGSAHTVGDLAFDGSGNLLVGVGDGALYVSPGGIATRTLTMRVQDPEVLVGKLLRVDPVTGNGVVGNPLFTGDGTSNASRLLAQGLRNPFRFTVDGDRVIVGDVGEATFEEVNVVQLEQLAGTVANYGWPCLEADLETPLEGIDDPDSPWHPCLQIRQDGPELPVHKYRHTGGGGSITAGRILDSTRYPASVRGQFLYGDYAQNHLRTVPLPRDAEAGASQPIADSTAAGGPVKIFAGPDGWTWTVSIYGGSLQRLSYADDTSNDVCTTGQFRRGFHDLDGPDSLFDEEYPKDGWEWLKPYNEIALPSEVIEPTECVDDVTLAPTTGSPWATAGEPDVRDHPGDRFGVSWRGRVLMEGGTYRFRVRGSEWMRLRIDDEPVHDFFANDFWSDSQYHVVELEPGLHNVSVEYIHGDQAQAYAGVTWTRIGGPPEVSLDAPDNGVVTDGTADFALSVSDPDGDPVGDLIARTRVVAEFLHYGPDGSHHVHPQAEVEGVQSGSIEVKDVHAPGSGVVRLRAVTTDASGASTRSAPVYVCFPGGEVGPCAE